MSTFLPTFLKEFETLMLKQKKLAKSKAKFSFNSSDVKWIDFSTNDSNNFVGYKEVKTKRYSLLDFLHTLLVPN